MPLPAGVTKNRRHFTRRKRHSARLATAAVAVVAVSSVISTATYNSITSPPCSTQAPHSSTNTTTRTAMGAARYLAKLSLEGDPALACNTPTFSTVVPSCTPLNATTCTSDSIGTFVTFSTNPTHADTALSFFVNCHTSILTYAQHISAAGFHQDAVVTGSGWPVTIRENWNGGSILDSTNNINLNTGCVGQGDFGATTMSAASAGAVAITIAANPASSIHAGSALFIGVGKTQELAQVDAIAGTSVTLHAGLSWDQPAGTRVRVPKGIDLIIDIATDGTAGTDEDALKIQGGAGCVTGQIADDPNHDGSNCPGINIAGNLNCGPAGAGVHQDGVQYIGGTNVNLFDVRIGNWAGNVHTCRGDGGATYMNGAPPNGNNGGTCNKTTAVNCLNFGWPVNILEYRVVSISCIHGLAAKLPAQSGAINGANSSGTVRNGIWRSNNCGTFSNPGPLDSGGANYASGITTLHGSGTSGAGPNWSFGTSTTAVTDVLGDRWCQTGCAWSPGFDPANNSR